MTRNIIIIIIIIIVVVVVINVVIIIIILLVVVFVFIIVVDVIVTVISPLTARVTGAPQMISQSVSNKLSKIRSTDCWHHAQLHQSSTVSWWSDRKLLSTEAGLGAPSGQLR